MNANQVEFGQFFYIIGEDNDVLQRIPSNLGEGNWSRYPGVLCINTKTGGFHGLGGENLVNLCARPENLRREMIMTDVVEIVSREYEFGVGAISQAHDPYYDYAQRKPTGEKRPKLVGRGLARGPMPHGQLYQECRKPGCGNEPVCVDCEYCENHCHCGD